MSAEIGTVIVLGVIAVLILFLGWKKGFFHLEEKPWPVAITLIQLLGAFAIYFLASYFLSNIGIKVLKKMLTTEYIGLMSWLNFGISFIIAILLGVYLFLLPRTVAKGILRREPYDHPIHFDIWAAIYAWVMAFPLVLFLSQALEVIVSKIFGTSTLPDQIAVKFLKATFDSPTYFILAVLSITILAPLVEETLFRGFLQTFIRKHLGPKQAIIITSICFSLFHYAAGQGLGNIMIILSLFVLALFLGFLYEKQGSILAPMVLHSLFNTVSVINLYLFGGFTSAL